MVTLRSTIREWFTRLFHPPQKIDLARVQWQVREERRAALERELSGMDARACMARVRRRMQEGNGVWVPPMYGREAAFKDWKRRHRIRGNGKNIVEISGRMKQQ